MSPLRKLLCLHIFFILTLSAWGQQQPTALDLEIKRAQLAFDIKKYNTAANLFKKIYPKMRDEEKQNQVLYMIAESYRRANNFKLAYDWYEKLVNTKYPDPRILYSYGLLLKNFERYEDAARQFSDYLFEVPNDAQAKRELQSCAIATAWKGAPKKIDVRNVPSLNTPFSDYAPFYTSGRLVWASSRQEATGNEIFEWTGQKCSDFFEASPQGSSWTKPVNLKGGVNSDFNEGVAWIDSSYTTMYFTQCNGSDGKGMNCKIYVSYFQNNQWTSPEKLPFNSDSFSVGHPALTANGDRMYFASNMPGGYGEKDLYYVTYNRVKNSWGPPVNLGPLVNSAEDDMFPYVHESGTLYFASKGHTGMGGFDLFQTGDSASAFRTPENLQYPVNSGGDDFGISFLPSWFAQQHPDRPYAYYTSNRQGGKGDDDIYSMTVKPFLFVLKGKVLDRETNSPVVATVKMTTAEGDPVFEIKTGPSGEFTGETPLNKQLVLSASKEKYFSSMPLSFSTLGIQKDTTVEVILKVDPIPTEDVEFTLEGIYYDLDKATLRPESKQVLDSLTAILKNNPGIVIELASHTDSRAPADYNMKLSQRRAQSCVDYLLEKGIPKDRLVPVGYGETKLVNDCADNVECSEEEHQQNRRTTFRVLRTDYKSR